MSLAEFPWPPLEEGSEAPVWSGSRFQCGAAVLRVLPYGDADSNWSESLTDLHEDAAGTDHPIDAASRRLAVESMLRLKGRPGLAVLDAGCSSGSALADLGRALPGAGLIGADYLRGPLENLARRAPGLPLLQFDLRKCPLPDASVDGVVCLNVLEHIDDDAAALRHLHRILKPGGIAHIEVPAGPGLYDIYDEVLMHHRRYRLRDIGRMARGCGFTVLRSTHIGFLANPAFWCAKKLHRRRLSLPDAEKRRIVAGRIRSTRRSLLLSAAFRAEILLGRVVPYPVGIRCVLVLGKG
jgi:SAM-dependent methyltransferase